MIQGIDGLLLVAKPSGPTSHDLVARVRRVSGQRRIGHSGTLDPLASGLLLLALGQATRLVRFLPHSPKVYTGTIQLGVRTDSDDLAGKVESRHAGPLPELVRVLAVAHDIQKRTLQVPPAFSARKIGGRRMYRMARQGLPVEASPAPIEIFRFELEPRDRAGLYGFVAEVSAGTYIRGLARDLGNELGCGATLASLCRTRIGPLELGDAVSVPEEPAGGGEWVTKNLIPIGQMPLSPPAFRLVDPDQVRRFQLGGTVRFHPAALEAEGMLRVLAPSGDLLGIADRRGDLLQPRVVLCSRTGATRLPVPIPCGMVPDQSDPSACTAVLEEDTRCP